MKTSRTTVVALLHAAATQLEAISGAEAHAFDAKKLLWEAFGRAKKKGLIKRMLGSPKKGVLGIETNNPAIEKVVFTDLDKDIAEGVIYTVDGKKGWGWSTFHKPAPLFLEPSTKLKVSVWSKKPDPVEEADTIVANYLRAFRDVGMVFDGKKAVPLSDLSKPVPPPASVPAPEPEPEEVWSVVEVNEDDNYAADVHIFRSKAEALKEAQAIGGVYVVKGTQMWNEPIGQVEEHRKMARYLYVQ
jgi:hypothetical protein